MNLVHFVFIIFLFQALKEIYYAFAEDLLPEPGICGRGMPTDRIVGGRAAVLGEFPWMALIQYSKPQNQIGFHCGGALINERYVLTASHCIIGQNVPLTWEVTTVRLGEYDFLSKHDCVGEECLDPEEVKNFSIEEIITHNGYDPTNKNQLNDIALLRLAEKVNYTRFISPICLPRSDMLRNLNITGHVMDVAGWGLNSSGAQSTILQKTYLKVDNFDKCKEVYEMRSYTLEKTQICAGGEDGIDTCRGDSGGPLVGRDFHQYPDGRKRPFFYAAGIISFGTHDCGVPNWPGVYTKVSDYIDWIEKNIKP